MNKITKYTNGDFSEGEFEKISEALINAKLDRDKKRAWTQKLQEDYGVERTEANNRFFKRKQTLFVLTIAASMALILSVFLLLPTKSESPHLQAVNEYIANLNIMANQAIMRKGKQEVEEVRKEANLSYSKAKYEESILLWNRLVNSGLAEGMDYFYLALSHLQKSKPEANKSIEYLLKSRSMDKSLEAEISWVLSLAYLKAGEIENGIDELSKIVQNNKYKVAEAKRLLEILKEG